jgi:hypothetical protein
MESIVEQQLLKNGYYIFYLKKAQTKTNSDVWIEGYNYYLYANPSYKPTAKITEKDEFFSVIKEVIKRNNCPFDIKFPKDFCDDSSNKTVLKSITTEEELTIGGEKHLLSVLVFSGVSWKEKEVLVWLKDFCAMHICLSFIDYLQTVLDDSNNKKGKNSYYRGQPSFFNSWVPSLYRETKWVDNEVLLNSRVMSRHVDEFIDCKTTIERLIKLKHYNQPSRLLDIVANPLMALFFACDNEKEKSSGMIATIFSNRDAEKFSLISDTVVELSSLAMNNRKLLLSKCPQIPKNKVVLHYTVDDDKTCCDTCVVNSFLGEQAHQCKKDMGIESYWNNITFQKLNQCIVVHPEENNIRIKQQQGLFILCGLNPKDIYQPPKTYNNFFKYKHKRYYYYVPKIIVDDCLKSLHLLGITKSQVYFDLDKTIEYEKGELLK